MASGTLYKGELQAPQKERWTVLPLSDDLSSKTYGSRCKSVKFSPHRNARLTVGCPLVIFTASGLLFTLSEPMEWSLMQVWHHYQNVSANFAILGLKTHTGDGLLVSNVSLRLVLDGSLFKHVRLYFRYLCLEIAHAVAFSCHCHLRLSVFG